MKNRKTIQDKKKEVIQHLMDNYAIKTVACRKTGIGRTQFYEWMKIDDEFAVKVKEIEESFLDYMESKLLELAELNDRAAIMFFLKAKGKDRGYK